MSTQVSQAYARLQNISTTGVDSRGLEGTPGDSIRGGRQRVFRPLERKSCAISRLVDRPGSGSIPAASTSFYNEINDFAMQLRRLLASTWEGLSCRRYDLI